MEIKTTTDYSMFRRLEGNRPVTDAHVEQIKEKIKAKGLKFTIIIVNENMEVIDGQHRLRALEELGLPVHYVVRANTSFEDCVLMNASQAPWSITDFIFGFAERGNAHYVALKEMCETYGFLGISTICAVISRRVKGVARTKQTSMEVRTGEFVFPFDDAESLKAEFDYLSQFSIVRKNAHGRSDIFYQTIAACYECSEINNERLLERMISNPTKLKAYNTFRDCLDAVQDVYNLYSRKKVYVQHEVEQMLDEAKKGGNK